MTGFAQTGGLLGAARWSWEIKTVNAKGLDLRLRMPPGFDALESEVRRRIGAALTRGTCHATLTIGRDTVPAVPRLNRDLLESLIATLATIPLPPSVGPATLDGLLGLRGIIEIGERDADPDDMEAMRAACALGLDDALTSLVAMRAVEGTALASVLADRLVAFDRLTHQADQAPERRPEAVMAKLAQTIAGLMERHALDPERLHQEALLIAAKADVREELDRLAAHVVAARDLLTGGGPVGRRLDFLAQELGREASTFCAKVNDAALTAIGLELRVEIEQFREQVQNIE